MQESRFCCTNREREAVRTSQIPRRARSITCTALLWPDQSKSCSSRWTGMQNPKRSASKTWLNISLHSASPDYRDTTLDKSRVSPALQIRKRPVCRHALYARASILGWQCPKNFPDVDVPSMFIILSHAGRIVNEPKLWHHWTKPLKALTRMCSPWVRNQRSSQRQTSFSN